MFFCTPKLTSTTKPQLLFRKFPLQNTKPFCSPLFRFDQFTEGICGMYFRYSENQLSHENA